ncbi:MAG: HAD family hydrolase [Polyangiales bacterium]|jgi:phosphoglycolate phosphatase-like HAD superfamily hydrolase
MQRIIALFDIDGTLLRAGGAGRRAVELAVGEVLDELDDEVSLQSVEFAGRTDPWIVRAALMQYGVAAEDDLIREVLRRYVAHLPRELERADAFEVLPGVLALLSELSDREDLVLGLGTGNTEPAAYAKLARGGLDSFFAFGGFGSDHAERPEVLRTALHRGLERTGVQMEDARVVVIGDTPHDVAAARAIGAHCVAVSTGGYEPSALEAAGASVVVSDLRASAVRSVFDRGASE